MHGVFFSVLLPPNLHAITAVSMESGGTAILLSLHFVPLSLFHIFVK